MPRARYKNLVDTFAEDIRSGRLSPGERLPTHRQLAARHGLALVTASRVYSELAAMGLVSGETGRGTFVREISLPPGQGSGQMNVAPGMLDLNFNYPSLPGQAELLRTALRQLALSGDLQALLRYQPHAGRQHERAAVARHLLSRGLTVEADQVLLVSGAQHGLAVTLMALLKPGDVIAVDALTYSGFKVLAETLHLEMLAIPLTASGPDLDHLHSLCRKHPVRAVYSMPTVHNPLGWVMSLEQREHLVAIARQHNLMIIEDAAYAFLAEHAPPPLATLAPERTVYVGGFSKSVATGLRVGFVSAPAAWVKALERSIMATTWNVPGVMSAIAVAWLDDGTVAQLEAQKRQDARARQALAAQVLKGLTYISHPSSYFLWLPLAEEARADQIAMTLQRENIAVSTAEPFAVSAHVPHALRLALGSVDMTALREALLAVRKVVAW
ncbi:MULTISPECIES: PLP-dependent aminotransferase family protein [Pseudomonas]|jgi:DNA-binding transcriptional MocR family regulator|uniref:PLP-dependent aminotransferase family protein n=1 Tax=Pseudomonas veronii TaxID=76761 RepID=A0A4P7Y8A6_PSEVE|nr:MULTISPECIES: PLP-dependent aminotransferase family protein [Pseudomonas]PMU86195.1 PLP-dependent aminotransferase family protein [Pseudomonas sp. GW704-F3]PMU89292.1 PLP-dependent aminotransferase family protein [Pseudomonas sp. GW704-F5]PMU99166.1 PLP-dependent aminotransferase family protein [Pseudomonas sp. MPBD4-3]PMV33271.1 PLP-dependent aminotransferase family protein [Pseudomonas sp. GW704-F2]QCG67261.1 PLP-dependent aminotransferase family protein [Pseudomonas veronii]